MVEASGSAPDSPAGHSGSLNAYTKQALDDLVSKILDEDSNSHHLNGASNIRMSCDEFKQNVSSQRFDCVCCYIVVKIAASLCSTFTWNLIRKCIRD